MSSQGSRLAQIQMRYQQKQMQENAQKKNEMFDETQKLLSSSLGAGKVRAMFDERRQRKTAGIDKSYLLEPIVVDTNKISTTTTTTKRVIGPSKPSRMIDQRMNYSKVIVPPLQNRLINHDINGNNHFSSSNDPLDKTFREPARIPPNTKTANDKLNSTIMMVKKTAVNSQANSSSNSSSPLKNVTNQNNKESPARSFATTNSNSSSARSMASGKTNSSGQSRTQSTVIKKISSPEKSSIQNSFDDDENDDIDDTPVPEGLIRCSICKRNFAEDRIEKHQVICQKSKSKKRKIFDASKKRVQGTEAESYNKKPLSGARSKTQKETKPAEKKGGWRAKHEDFIRTVRAAKEMQIHLAKGGKLTDLPPPPPSENPDYVQCPHCNRRFNEAAANRHIPLCKNMQHNKPKPKAASVTNGKLTSQMKKR